ncbi:MAG: hypothetical protein IT270_20480 [Saprospiraceae bacterium]|nr:hypothetical protein [Saprospiraceae bacterium]
MPNFKISLLLLLLSAGFFTACNKDDDDDKSKTEILTGPSCWLTVKSETFDANSGVWIESQVPNCDKDDCTRFYSDGVIIIDEGPLLCDAGDPLTIEGTWFLSLDESSITLTLDGVTVPAKIIEISDNKLVVEIEFLSYKTRTTYNN